MPSRRSRFAALRLLAGSSTALLVTLATAQFAGASPQVSPGPGNTTKPVTPKPTAPQSAPPTSPKPEGKPTGAPATEPDSKKLDGAPKEIVGPDGKPTKVVPLESYPDDPKIAIVQRLLGGGQYEYAKNLLNQVLTARPDVGRAEFFLGVTLAKMKLYEEAREHLERSLQFHQPFPEAKHAHHFMGWASYHLGELGRARSDFEAHLAEVPNEPDSIFALGLIAFDEDRLDDAEASFLKAIELQSGPESKRRDVSKAWIRLGDVSMRRDNPAEAEERFMKGLALYADHYEGWAKLARARDRQGKAKEAESARNEELRARERVGRLDPEPPAAAPTQSDPKSQEKPDQPAAAPPTAPPTAPPSAPPSAPKNETAPPPTESQPKK